MADIESADSPHTALPEAQRNKTTKTSPLRASTSLEPEP
jgi:hypothetical protein